MSGEEHCLPAKPAEASGAGWEGFAAEGSSAACPAWRRYCDRLHTNLIAEWCAGRTFRRALKTDVFDEAVGEGCFGALAKVATEVQGVDCSEPLVNRVLGERKGFQVSRGDVRKLEFADGWCDLIFSNSTLDHFASRAEIVQSIAGLARVLAPGGLLLITLDNPQNPVVWCRNLLPQRPLEAAGLVPYFMGATLAMSDLVDVLGAAGFRVLRRRHTMHAPRIAFLHLLRAMQKSPGASGMIVQAMLAMEEAAGFPTAARTGHYSAVLAEKWPAAVVGGQHG